MSKARYANYINLLPLLHLVPYLCLLALVLFTWFWRRDGPEDGGAPRLYCFEKTCGAPASGQRHKVYMQTCVARCRQFADVRCKVYVVCK